MPDKIDRIRRAILPILKKRRVKRAAIFGSVARGEERKRSDVDILVEFKGKASLFDLGGLQYDLQEKLRKKVDVVTYRSIDPRLKRSILSDAVTIL